MLLLEPQNPSYTKPLVSKNKKPEMSQGLTVWEWLGCVPCDTFPFFIKRPNHRNHRWIFSYFGFEAYCTIPTCHNCDYIWDNLWKVFKPQCLWAFNFYMTTTGLCVKIWLYSLEGVLDSSVRRTQGHWF